MMMDTPSQSEFSHSVKL